MVHGSALFYGSGRLTATAFLNICIAFPRCVVVPRGARRLHVCRIFAQIRLSTTLLIVARRRLHAHGLHGLWWLQHVGIPPNVQVACGVRVACGGWTSLRIGLWAVCVGKQRELLLRQLWGLRGEVIAGCPSPLVAQVLFVSVLLEAVRRGFLSRFVHLLRCGSVSCSFLLHFLDEINSLLLRRLRMQLLSPPRRLPTRWCNTSFARPPE